LNYTNNQVIEATKRLHSELDISRLIRKCDHDHIMDGVVIYPCDMERFVTAVLEAVHQDEPRAMFGETVYVYSCAANDPDQVGHDLTNGYYTSLEDCLADNPYVINKIDDIARVTIEHLDMTEIRKALA
jgi:hypothetical protein